MASVEMKWIVGFVPRSLTHESSLRWHAHTLLTIFKICLNI